MIPPIYHDLAKQTYSKEQFKQTVGQMLPMLASHASEEMPPELIDRLVQGMQAEYEQALAIQLEVLRDTYNEPQAAILHDFYNANPWVLSKATEFAMKNLERMMTDFAPGLAERIIEEYEKHLDTLDVQEMDLQISPRTPMQIIEENGGDLEKEKV